MIITFQRKQAETKEKRVIGALLTNKQTNLGRGLQWKQNLMAEGKKGKKDSRDGPTGRKKEECKK